MADETWTVAIKAPSGNDAEWWIFIDSSQGLGISQTREAIEGQLRNGLEDLIAGQFRARYERQFPELAATRKED